MKFDRNRFHTSVANSQDRTSNDVESFHAALCRRVGVSHPNLFIFLKHLGKIITKMSQDTVVDWDRLTRGCQIRRWKKTTALNDSVSKLASTKLHQGIMYTRYEFLSVVRHTRTIPSEQLDDVDDSEDDSTETYDVEEVMALATINEAAPTTECLEYI